MTLTSPFCFIRFQTIIMTYTSDTKNDIAELEVHRAIYKEQKKRIRLLCAGVRSGVKIQPVLTSNKRVRAKDTQVMFESMPSVLRILLLSKKNSSKPGIVLLLSAGTTPSIEELCPFLNDSHCSSLKPLGIPKQHEKHSTTLNAIINTMPCWTWRLPQLKQLSDDNPITGSHLSCAVAKNVNFGNRTYGTAGLVIASLMSLKNSVEEGTHLSYNAVKSNRNRIIDTYMHMLLFRAVRVSGQTTDTIKYRVPQSGKQHIVLQYKNHLYGIQVTQEDGTVIHPSNIQLAIDSVLDDGPVSENPFPLTLLSSLPRRELSEDILFNNNETELQSVVSIIEESVCVISLSDCSGSNIVTESCSPFSCWLGKSLHVRLFSDGTMSFVGDSSIIDPLTLIVTTASLSSLVKSSIQNYHKETSMYMWISQIENHTKLKWLSLSVGQILACQELLEATPPPHELEVLLRCRPYIHISVDNLTSVIHNPGIPYNAIHAKHSGFLTNSQWRSLEASLISNSVMIMIPKPQSLNAVPSSQVLKKLYKISSMSSTLYPYTKLTINDVGNNLLRQCRFEVFMDLATHLAAFMLHGGGEKFIHLVTVFREAFFGAPIDYIELNERKLCEVLIEKSIVKRNKQDIDKMIKSIAKKISSNINDISSTISDVTLNEVLGSIQEPTVTHQNNPFMVSTRIPNWVGTDVLISTAPYPSSVINLSYKVERERTEFLISAPPKYLTSYCKHLKWAIRILRDTVLQNKKRNPVGLGTLLSAAAATEMRVTANR